MSEKVFWHYRATLPDGTVITRKSHRDYTHVAAWRYFPGGNWIASYAGSEKLAQIRANHYRHYHDVTVVPVERTRA